MKKIFIYLFAFVFICFFLPAVFTKNDINTFSEKNNENTNFDGKEKNSNEQKIDNNYEYKKYGTIKLLHKKTGQVETVDIDSYLCNVVSAEMPVDYELEALKAQAIVARTYTVFKVNNKKHDNADICDDSNCCQAWISKDDRLSKWEESKRESNWQKIENAVNLTKGKIITYQNVPINAFFHSNSGGTTEIPVNVWGGSGYPYLQVVETSGEEGYNQYASEAIFSKEELIKKLSQKYADIKIDFNNQEEIKILEYTDSGRVKTIRFGNHEISGVEARSLFGLRSANFEVTLDENKNIKFSVKGYGHGVGMSQTGANTLAKEGKSCDDIIHHFYTDVEIKDINSI